jgi:hypothetical protein
MDWISNPGTIRRYIYPICAVEKTPQSSDCGVFIIALWRCWCGRSLNLRRSCRRLDCIGWNRCVRRCRRVRWSKRICWYWGISRFRSKCKSWNGSIGWNKGWSNGWNMRGSLSGSWYASSCWRDGSSDGRTKKSRRT